jgi:uncharacterized membrane protein
MLYTHLWIYVIFIKKKLYQLVISNLLGFKKIECVGLTIYKILEVGLIIIMNLNPAQLCPWTPLIRVICRTG